MPDENTTKDHGDKLLSWQFPEFNQYKRDRVWYISAAIVILLLLIYAVFSNNILFAIVIVMIAAATVMLQRNARELTFTIYEDGIMVGQQFFDYKDIDSFYIIYEPPEIKSLIFEFKSLLNPRAPINLMNQNPVKVREILLQYLDEDLDRENEPLSEQIGRILKL